MQSATAAGEEQQLEDQLQASLLSCGLQQPFPMTIYLFIYLFIYFSFNFPELDWTLTQQCAGAKCVCVCAQEGGEDLAGPGSCKCELTRTRWAHTVTHGGRGR
jgi:hypothetical protein